MIDRLPARMRAKIAPEPCPVVTLHGPCWAWTGALASRKYGSVGYRGRTWSTHRLVYTLLVGAIPAGLELDHLCRNIRCCNPGHLEPVTRKVNAERSAPATKTRCLRNHEYTPENTIWKRGARNCRECTNQWQRDYRASRRADVDDLLKAS